MKRLQLKKLASDVAFDTVSQTQVAMESAAAAQGTQLQLTDPQYQAFRNDVLQFRSMYSPAYQADLQEAATAAKAAANAKTGATAAPAAATKQS